MTSKDYNLDDAFDDGELKGTVKGYDFEESQVAVETDDGKTIWVKDSKDEEE